MATPEAELRAALAEAVKESKFKTEEDKDADSWENFDKEEETPAPAASAEDASTVESTDSTETDEADKAQPLPDEYWGTSLEGIPDETKAELIARFEQQDSYIQQLQARLAKEPVVPDPVTPPVETEEVTDEALLRALGFDPEDFETQSLAPRILPLARTTLALEDKVDALIARETTREVETSWNTALNELETTYGKLPGDRIQVLRYAVEEKISSPFEVYFRLSAPAKHEVETAVAEARRAAAKKAEGGGVKPRSDAGSSPVIDPKTTSLRDATKIAMLEAEKETGLSFKNIFGRKQFKTEEVTGA